MVEVAGMWEKRNGKRFRQKRTPKSSNRAGPGYLGTVHSVIFIPVIKEM